jgi:hypothetical protein
MKLLLKTVLCVSVVLGCNRSTPCEKEIYLIPEGLKGQIIVFLDQPDGQAVQYEGEARLYQIPSSGLLKSQFKRNGGCMGDNRIRFFYVDSIGDRTPVAFFMDIDRDTIPAGMDYVLMTFLSETNKKPDFIIHLLGRSDEFGELLKSVRNIDPEEILMSTN